MDVFLMIRRNKSTIFADAKETTTVYEVKKIIEGILKKAPEDQRLIKLVKDQQIVMEDSKQLSEYGYTHATARAQLPETIALVYRTGTNGDKDEFEPLEITPVSTPPELPDVMKSDSSNNQQQNIDLMA
jgi:transcription elongation factor B subunit 2